jgi:hypothetical protein
MPYFQLEACCICVAIILTATGDCDFDLLSEQFSRDIFRLHLGLCQNALRDSNSTTKDVKEGWHSLEVCFFHFDVGLKIFKFLQGIN